jgi:hypothetical protein
LFKNHAGSLPSDDPHLKACCNAGTDLRNTED